MQRSDRPIRFSMMTISLSSRSRCSAMNWRSASGMEALHFMWITLPRRRRLSRLSNSSTRSSASSSTSTSLSRRRRNMPQPVTAWPGNSRSKYSAMTCSSGMKRTSLGAVSGRRMKRRSCGGTGISADRFLLSRLLVSCTAMVKPRLGMKGKGCAGSIASGVSTGKICSANWSSRKARSAALISSPVTTAMPCLRSSPCRSVHTRLLVGDQARAPPCRLAPAAAPASGRRPMAWRRWLRTMPIRPATRTM